MIALPEPRLIGLDWGTSTLRAYLLSDAETIVQCRSRPWGIMSGAARDFSTALAEAIGDWDAAFPGLPAIAAGMVGSSEGWVRAPYCPCPAGVAELAQRLVAVSAKREGTLHVVPGVEQRGAVPDVMRGEETQIAGAWARHPELAAAATLVLPGTHAKWAVTRDQRIEAFTTYVTGELYALFAGHSILGRPARAAFARGVRTARDAGTRSVTATVFSTRSLVLAGELDAGDSLDFLSGLLIGEEVRSGLATGAERPALVGDPVLCARYAQAFALFDVPPVLRVDESAPAGLWRIASAAGLLAAHGDIRTAAT